MNQVNNMKKFKEFYENNNEFNRRCTYTNVDDILRDVVSKGYEEVSASKEEMLIISGFMLANLYGLESKDINIMRHMALVEGKVDKCLGVKLILEK